MSALSNELDGRLAALVAGTGSRDASVRVWRENRRTRTHRATSQDHSSTRAKSRGEEAMKLLTKELRRRLPPLYATESVKDPVAQVKFFTPWAGWTWYATEFDGVDTFLRARRRAWP